MSAGVSLSSMGKSGGENGVRFAARAYARRGGPQSAARCRDAKTVEEPQAFDVVQVQVGEQDVEGPPGPKRPAADSRARVEDEASAVALPDLDARRVPPEAHGHLAGSRERPATPPDSSPERHFSAAGPDCRKTGTIPASRSARQQRHRDGEQPRCRRHRSSRACRAPVGVPSVRSRGVRSIGRGAPSRSSRRNTETALCRSPRPRRRSSEDLSAARCRTRGFRARPR